MDITPLVRAGQQIIISYAGGVFKVNKTSYPHAIIVMPEKTISWDIGVAKDVAELTISNFSIMIDKSSDIDVLLLGCGKEMAFLPPKLRTELKQAGLSVDIMDSGAACRTYNVLMAEGRRVACALLPV